MTRKPAACSAIGVTTILSDPLNKKALRIWYQLFKVVLSKKRALKVLYHRSGRDSL